MRKKNYIKPETNSVAIQAQTFLQHLSQNLSSSKQLNYITKRI